jgi:adenosylmethionine-8-amino-7-oxononanoate aminotransferase
MTVDRVSGSVTSDAGSGSSLSDAARRHLWMHFTEMERFERTAVPIIERAEGCYVYDADGRRFFDAHSGLLCVNVGHGRQEIGEAIAAQIGRLDYWPLWGSATPVAIELAERIAHLAPGDLSRVFFTNSGSESIESAWKLARQYHRLRGNPGKTGIVARQGAYHGTTFGALSITGIPGLRDPFGPLVPGVLHGPRLDPYHADTDAVTHSIACADALGELIDGAGADSIAAVVIEPVQNSGGSLVAEPVYFSRLREICDERDVLLVSDETICSWGRLGTFFGSERFAYQPDIITTAKGITSGYVPMGAVIASDRVAEPFAQAGASFNHGLTFGGHPVAAAAALANIDIIEREGLCEHADHVGGHFRERLEELRANPLVGDVRGVAMFQSIELVADQATKAPFTPDQLAVLRQRLPVLIRERGVICRAMHRGNPLVQFAPPLVSTEEQLTWLRDCIGSALDQTLTELRAAG